MVVAADVPKVAMEVAVVMVVVVVGVAVPGTAVAAVAGAAVDARRSREGAGLGRGGGRSGVVGGEIMPVCKPAVMPAGVRDVVIAALNAVQIAAKRSCSPWY